MGGKRYVQIWQLGFLVENVYTGRLVQEYKGGQKMYLCGGSHTLKFLRMGQVYYIYSLSFLYLLPQSHSFKYSL